MTPLLAAAPANEAPARVEYRRSLFRSSLVFGAFSFASYCLSLLKTIFVTRYFGTSPAMDAFVMSVLVPNMLGLLLTGSSAISLIPALAIAEQQSFDERANTFRAVLIIFLVVSCILAIGVSAFAVPIVALIASGFGSPQRSLTVQLLRVASPLLLFNSLCSVSAAELLSRRKHVLVAATPAIATGISFVAILLLHKVGVIVLVYGLVLGTGMQALAVTLPAWQRNRRAHAIRFWTPLVRKVASAQVPLLFVSCFGVINVFVDQGVAALLPTGNVSALSYASSLNLIVMQMVVMAASWVALPEFSALVAAQEFDKLRELSRRCIRGLALVSAPVCVLILVSGDVVVRTIFQHGTFDQKSTELVYLTWAGYALGLLPLAIGMIAARLVNAFGDNSVLVKLGLLTLPLNAILDYVLMRKWGCFGISLGTSLVFCVSGVVLLVWLRKRLGPVVDAVTRRVILRSSICSAIAGLLFVSLRHSFGETIFAIVTLGLLFCVMLLFLYTMAEILVYLPSEVQKSIHSVGRLLGFQ